MRFERQRGGHLYAYSGKENIGHIVSQGDNGPYAWRITDVAGSKYQRATCGKRKTEADAQRAFREAWAYWLAERGLKEAD